MSTDEFGIGKLAQLTAVDCHNKDNNIVTVKHTESSRGFAVTIIIKKHTESCTGTTTRRYMRCAHFRMRHALAPEQCECVMKRVAAYTLCSTPNIIAFVRAMWLRVNEAIRAKTRHRSGEVNSMRTRKQAYERLHYIAHQIENIMCANS